MIFDLENSLWKSNSALCDELAKPGKASQDAFNPGLWLILLDILKNLVAEGIASYVNDFRLYNSPNFLDGNFYYSPNFLNITVQELPIV